MMKNDILLEIIHSLKEYNKIIESASKNQKSYENNSINIQEKKSNIIKDNSVVTPNSVKAQNYSTIDRGDITLQKGNDVYSTDLEKVDAIITKISTMWDAVSKSMGKLQSRFDSLSKSLENVNENIESNNKNKKLTFDEKNSILGKKGFRAAVRRGILDIHDMSSESGKKEKIGRAIGKGMTIIGNVPMSHRRFYAKEFLHPEIEYKRAISNTEEERSKLLPHEEQLVEERKSAIRSGKLSTGDLTEDQYIEKFKKKIVAEANLKAIRSKDVNYRTDLQKEWMVDSGNLAEYNSKEIMARAKKENPDDHLRITKDEKLNHIIPLKKKLKRGEINTYGIPHEVYEKQEEQLVVLKNNLQTLDKNFPEYGNEEGGLKERYKKKIEKLQTARENAKKQYYGYDKKVEASPSDFSVIKMTQENKKAKKLYSNPEKNVSQGITKLMSPNDFKMANIKADRIDVKELGLTTLKVERLETPMNNTQLEPKQYEDAVAPQETVGGNLDFDISERSRPRKTSSKILGKIANIGKKAFNISKAAAPMLGTLAVSNVADYGLGEIGVGKDEFGKTLTPDTFQDDINWNRMSVGEKIMSSVPRGIESIGNLIGLENISTQAKVDRIKKETEMYSQKNLIGDVSSKVSTKPTIDGNIIKNTEPIEQNVVNKGLIRSSYINPVMDTKLSELDTVKYENEVLLQKERETILSKQNTPPVIINNQNQVGSQQQYTPPVSTVRSAFNAYERFVNRTFTVI